MPPLKPGVPCRDGLIGESLMTDVFVGLELLIEAWYPNRVGGGVTRPRF